MIVNLEHLENKDIDSRVHKVRAIIMNPDGKIYITNMDSSYNLPGGRVEVHENLEDALIREVKEELGVRVLKKEIRHIGNITFWHKNFPGGQNKVNRENMVDLFWITVPKEVDMSHVSLTNYEKHYHFCLMNCGMEEIKKLLLEQNDNEYKKFTDVELKVCLEEFLKYQERDSIC